MKNTLTCIEMAAALLAAAPTAIAGDSGRIVAVVPRGPVATGTTVVVHTPRPHFATPSLLAGRSRYNPGYHGYYASRPYFGAAVRPRFGVGYNGYGYAGFGYGVFGHGICFCPNGHFRGHSRYHGLGRR
jgi:hypothetical protein